LRLHQAQSVGLLPSDWAIVLRAISVDPPKSPDSRQSLTERKKVSRLAPKRVMKKRAFHKKFKAFDVGSSPVAATQL
jgi:hypothetical protein